MGPLFLTSVFTKDFLQETIFQKTIMRVLFLMLACTLSGCGLNMFTEPKTNPEIEDRIGSPLSPSGELIGTLSTTAERRIVVAPLVPAKAGLFCAEPSPDAAESLAAIFKASAEVEATGANSVSQSAKGALARTLITSVGALTRRSQGLQFFRDGVFALCQFRMNGFISTQEFERQYYELRDASAALIQAEVSKANWNAPATLLVLAPPVPGDDPADGDDTGDGAAGGT